MLNYAKSIPRWRAQGYRVKLFFLTLPSVEIAVERVAERVPSAEITVDMTSRKKRSGAVLSRDS